MILSSHGDIYIMKWPEERKALDAAKKRNPPCKLQQKYTCGPVHGIRPILQAQSEYSVHSLDGGEALFNEDVFSGTGVTNVFLVVLLECTPVGHQGRHEIVTKQNDDSTHLISCIIIYHSLV